MGLFFSGLKEGRGLTPDECLAAGRSPGCSEFELAAPWVISWCCCCCCSRERESMASTLVPQFLPKIESHLDKCSGKRAPLAPISAPVIVWKGCCYYFCLQLYCCKILGLYPMSTYAYLKRKEAIYPPKINDHFIWSCWRPDFRSLLFVFNNAKLPQHET